MVSVIIVAGGKGLRMGGEIPKQFLPIGGVPVLMRTIRAFYEADEGMRIIVVIPESQQEMWTALCGKYRFCIPHKLAYGGANRYESVRNGLMLVDDSDGVVCVHDGVRPFVSGQVIRTAVAEARKGKAVVPVVPVIDSLREYVGGQRTKVVNRADYCMVQTPQVFPVKMLRTAYDMSYDETFTDDASVVERAGETICTIEGNRENIKLTTSMDLLVAEALLAK